MGEQMRRAFEDFVRAETHHRGNAPKEPCNAELGDDADRATVSRVVAQAEGHAFFLEELIRAAEGGDTLPETVRATVEGRLEGLESDARRILRAASIYGGSFSPEGVASAPAPTPPAPSPGSPPWSIARCWCAAPSALHPPRA